MENIIKIDDAKLLECTDTITGKFTEMNTSMDEIKAINKSLDFWSSPTKDKYVEHFSATESNFETLKNQFKNVQDFLNVVHANAKTIEKMNKEQFEEWYNG